jgi:GT2 family glycosyltransferase
MLVSVVIPTHNRPDMLAEALASVRVQTFTDYEIIVVSNGETVEMRQASRNKAIEYGARYIALSDGNASAARNCAVERARGEWIAFLDDDDLWLPEKLERQLAEARHADADMVTCDYTEFYPDGGEKIYRWRLLDGWSHRQALSHGIWIAPPSMMMARRKMLVELGGYDPSLRHAEDTDMCRRISWAHTIHQVPEILVRRRCGHAQLTHDKRMQDIYELRHYFKMRQDTPPALRAILPSASFFVLPRLIALLAPQWLRRRLRPRTWLLMFCRWFRASERPWNILLWRLGRTSVLVRKAWKDLWSSEAKIADDGWTVI